MGFQREGRQAIHHEIVAADVPAGFQSDPFVHQPDRPHTAEIFVVEAPGKQPSPVRALHPLQPRHLVAQHLGEGGHLHHMAVKIVE